MAAASPNYMFTRVSRTPKELIYWNMHKLTCSLHCEHPKIFTSNARSTSRRSPSPRTQRCPHMREPHGTTIINSSKWAIHAWSLGIREAIEAIWSSARLIYSWALAFARAANHFASWKSETQEICRNKVSPIQGKVRVICVIWKVHKKQGFWYFLIGFNHGLPHANTFYLGPNLAVRLDVAVMLCGRGQRNEAHATSFPATWTKKENGSIRLAFPRITRLRWGHRLWWLVAHVVFWVPVPRDNSTR